MLGYIILLQEGKAAEGEASEQKPVSPAGDAPPQESTDAAPPENKDETEKQEVTEG